MGKVSYRFYDQNIWGNMPPEESVGNRNLLIAKLIKKQKPDFCLFQECNPMTSRSGENDIAALISEKFSEVCPEDAGKNFTPLFYRKDRFEAAEYGFEPFAGLNDRQSKSMTWAYFEDKRNGAHIIVVSTHFWWKNSGQEDHIQRIENAHRLYALCSSLVEKYHVPVVVMGDLNNGVGAAQGDSAYREMVTLGFTDARTLAKSSDATLTFHNPPVKNSAGKYKGTVAVPKCSLDHAFLLAADEVTVPRFAVLTDQDAADSSDHYPLVLDIEMKVRKKKSENSIMNYMLFGLKRTEKNTEEENKK